MSVPLHAIAYVSSATHLLDSGELEQLLVDAREFNVAQGVTGVLLYVDGCFMQCIEGPMEGVARVYQRIKEASRHRGLIELLNQPVKRRAFPDWHMGCGSNAQSEMINDATESWERMLSSAREVDESVPGLLLLRAFWKESRAARTKRVVARA